MFIQPVHDVNTSATCRPRFGLPRDSVLRKSLCMHGPLEQVSDQN